ncbi:MAG: NADAR family protein [Candidatus Heimdallarchaeota archaeon]
MLDSVTYSKGAILSFVKEYRFLSNFFPCVVIANDINFPSVEHYYQAMKTDEEAVQKRVAATLNATDAKGFGQKIQQDEDLMRKDFHTHKLKIMTEGLLQKFEPNTLLAEKLLSTEGYLLIEGNYWHDNYWGVDFKTGIGENKLGILLMRIREKLIQK